MKVTKYLIILLFVLFVFLNSGQAKEVMINGTKIETDQGVIIIILGENNDEMESKEKSIIYQDQEEKEISSEKILDLGPYNVGEIKLEPLPEEIKYRTGVVHNRTNYVQVFFVEDYVVRLNPWEQRLIRLRDLGKYYMKTILYDKQHQAIMQFESMMDINRQVIRTGKYKGFGWAFYPGIEHFKKIK